MEKWHNISYIKRKLHYWKGAPHFELVDQGRHYLLIEYDQAAFNNQRLTFEFHVILAWLTGRTLVLPSPRGIYLLDFGNITVLGANSTRVREGGYTEFGDIWDLHSLRGAISVIPMDEFLEKHRSKGVPSKFLNQHVFTWRVQREFVEWLESPKNPFIRQMHFGPLSQLLYYPSIASVGETYHVYPKEAWLQGREKQEMLPEWLNYPYLYVPDGDGTKYRQLANVHMAIAYANRSTYFAQMSLLRNFLHFTPEIFDLAAQAIQELGLWQYSSLHVRRGDNQFADSMVSSSKSYENIRRLLKQGEALYIASDETNPAFFRPYEAGQGKIWRLQDLKMWKTIPRKLMGMVEQVICAGGRVFVGTRHSTFTQYIHRLRGYIGAPNKMLYYDNTMYTGNLREDLKKRPPQVAQSYKEEFDIAWEFENEEQPYERIQDHWLP